MLAAHAHPGDLELRRYFIGEIEAATLDPHLEACAPCRERIRALVEEERHFQDVVPFERFAKGVRNKAALWAADTASAGGFGGRSPSAWVQWTAPLLTVAASVAVLVTVGLSEPSGLLPAGTHLKGGGGAEVDLYVGGQGGSSRVAASLEPLHNGERVRIAYRPGHWSYLCVISTDERGEVSLLYPTSGESLPIGASDRQTRLLPESVAFDGVGLERLVVLFSQQPLAMEEVGAAAERAFQSAEGDLQRVAPLGLPAKEIVRMVLKP